MARTARRVTRDDVARIAGVSTAVVSYVLNDGPRPYSESARRRVLAAVEKTGYRIHDVARALASGKSRVFGFAAPSLLNPFIAEVARAIALAAAERGALVLLGDTGEDQRREDRVLRSMMQREVDGIIYMSTNERLSKEIAHGSDIPTVIFEQAEDHPLVASVRVDELEASAELARHLVGHGRSRYAAVVGPTSMVNSSLRLSGFHQALDEAGVPRAHRSHRFAGTTREAGFLAAGEILRAEPGTDAIFAGNEALALGAIAAAAAMGRSVPGDIALVAFNGSHESRFHVPALTISRQPIVTMARAAVGILNSTTYQPADHYFPTELIVRASCGCPYELDPNNVEVDRSGSIE